MNRLVPARQWAQQIEHTPRTKPIDFAALKSSDTAAHSGL